MQVRNLQRTARRALIFAGLLPTALGMVALVEAQDRAMLDGYEIAVDDSGAIRVPEIDYRATWPVLGAWIAAGGDEVDGETGAAGIHTVYVQPGAIEAYRETGAFPDGTVLVKELLAAETTRMTTGLISHASETEGWFVTVKDTEGRFPDNKLWGDGWGWAYFDADAPGETSTESYRSECKACHVPARKTDWVYVQGYPVLGALAD